MNIDDFRYMWRGKTLKTLNQQEVHLIEPFNLHGKGRQNALLLLHGFSSSPAVFRELAPSLLPFYENIFCPALPGHGKNLSTFSQAKALDWQNEAEAVCALLMKKYQTVDVLGFSLGGLLACHLAQRFHIHHLYLLAPALALRLNINFALKCARILHFLGFHHLRNRAGNLHSQQHSEIAYRQLPISTIIEILALVKTFKFIPPQCPTDLFLGRHDEVVNSPVVANCFLDLPQTHLHWLEESAHVLPLDANIDTIIACIQKNQALP